MPRRLFLLMIVLLSAALPFQSGAGMHAHGCAHATQAAASAGVIADDAGMDEHAHHAQHGDHGAGHDGALADAAPSGCDCGCDCAGHCGGIGTMAFSLTASPSPASLHAAFAAPAPDISHASVHPAVPLRPPISA
jgi:hypothetical protein